MEQTSDGMLTCKAAKKFFFFGGGGQFGYHLYRGLVVWGNFSPYPKDKIQGWSSLKVRESEVLIDRLTRL